MATAYALLGPTAIGKSALALQLAALRKAACRPVEIVSADSAHVYRGMDIGTAKPTPEERAQVPHHLLDLVEPHERYSAGRWREDAIRAVLGIIERGHVPLIVGGTMLYYRALVAGLDELPVADEPTRKTLDEEARVRGWPALHAELAQVDSAAAARIAPGDSQRIQRALEVWRLTGRPLSALQRAAAPALPFPLKAYALVPRDRAWLHERIARRFEAMLAAGLVDELRTLRSRLPLSAELPSMRAVGYRQAWEYLEGRASEAELLARGIAATRQLAKRQLTWLRSLPGLLRLDAGGPQDAAVVLDLLLHELA